MAHERGPSAFQVERCVAAFQRIVHALQADDELAHDEQALVAMLDADPTILRPDELLRRFIAAIAFAESRAEEAATFAAGMKARSERYASRAAAMRTELLDVMLALERSSFSDSPFGSVSVRQGPYASRVTDEEKIPDEYFRTVTTRTLDRRALLDDLKGGVVIDGAELNNPRPVLYLTFNKAGAIT